jgi:hypothetical protein
VKELWNRGKRMTVCGIALLFFAAGSLLTASLMHVTQVKADNNRVFEIHIYHAIPGKLPALEAQFRDTTSKLLAKHNLNVVGYWVSEDTAPAVFTVPAVLRNTFVFVVAHTNREEAETDWRAFLADPAFQQVMKADQAEKLVETVDVTYMRPTDFSPMK